MKRVSSGVLGLITLVAIFGGIGLSMALDYWQTSSTKEPALIKDGDFAGLPNPADLRGSYTWADVAKGYGIPEASLLKAFLAEAITEKANSLEELYGASLPEGQEFGMEPVRLFVALYVGMPYPAGEGSLMPTSAIEVLRAEGKAEPALIDAAARNSIDLAKLPRKVEGETVPTTAVVAVTASASGTATPAKPAATPAPAPTSATPATPSSTAPAPATSTQPPVATETPKSGSGSGTGTPSADHEALVGQITGKTTFGDLAAWGFDKAKVEALLGGWGANSQLIKDFLSARGASFSELKPPLQELAPKTP